VPTLVEFLNSNFFIALVTLAVGTAAYTIYRLQKRDRKREAANIILLEIQSAERKLQQIKKSLSKEPRTLPNDLRLLPTENWSQFNYLFIKDFDRDEWDSLTDFYNKCELIDETIKYNNAAFWNDVEQIRSNKQRLLADFASASTKALEGTSDTVTEKDTETIKKFDDLTEKFDKVYMSKQDSYSYTPQKTLNDAKLYIGEINLRISQSNVGTKLKKLANIKSRL
jgi:hypothetical protein